MSGESVPSSPILAPLRHRRRAPTRTRTTVLDSVPSRWRTRTTQGQKRKSGDPCITYPVAVTTILRGARDDRGHAVVVCCTTPWRTPHTLDELREEFGEEVAAGGRRDQAGRLRGDA
ncbi:hypothetical protein QJS66_04220 [Kocuria rhizophila]|nr:hypothetical protein QJS66_04220 [Kocuria rhizophila]